MEKNEKLSDKILLARSLLANKTISRENQSNVIYADFEQLQKTKNAQKEAEIMKQILDRARRLNW